MANGEPINLAVLSAVRHARAYLPHFADLGVRLLAIAEDPAAPEWAWDAARTLAAQYGAPAIRGVDAVLERDDINLVLVCSEPRRHASLAEAALLAGKHVLVDKPMATSLAEADRLVSVAQNAPGRFTVIHRLFSPSIQRARKAIDAGQIGLIRAADVEWLASGGFSESAVERPELVADPALSGGGELMNFLVYPVSYLRYLTGAEVVEVYAEAGTFFFEPHHRYGVEDLAMLSLRLEYDIVATVTVGRVPAGPGGRHGASTMRLIGSHGYLTVDENLPELDIWLPEGRVSRRLGGDAGTLAVATLIREFIRDIQESRRPLFDVVDGWATIAAVEAAYCSAATRQPAPVAQWSRRIGRT